MLAALALPVAALAEIAGCFAVWAVLREGASTWWLVPGAVALGVFAVALTFVPTDAAGRAFAAYGGVYVAASLAWLRLVEGRELRTTDLIGAAVCVLGAGIVLAGVARRG